MINERYKNIKNLDENNIKEINFKNKNHSRNKSEDLNNYQVDTNGYKLSSTGEDKSSNFNSKDDLVLFQDKYEKKNKTQNNNETFMNTMDNMDKSTSNNVSSSSSAKTKTKIQSSRALSSLMFSKYININMNINNIKGTKKKKIKKVTFKKKIFEVIEIESFKKYNLDNGFNPDYKTDTKCSCIIY